MARTLQANQAVLNVVQDIQRRFNRTERALIIAMLQQDIDMTVTIEAACEAYGLEPRRFAAVFERARNLARGHLTAATSLEQAFRALAPTERSLFCEAVKTLQDYTDETFIGFDDVRLRHRISLDQKLANLAYLNFKQLCEMKGQKIKPFYRITTLSKALKKPNSIVGIAFPTFEDFSIWRSYARVLVGLQKDISSQQISDEPWHDEYLDQLPSDAEDENDRRLIEFERKLAELQRPRMPRERPRMPKRERPRMPQRN